MKIKDTLSLHAAPLLLRISVGVVFLWAGSAKLFTTTEYTGAEAQTLIELGLASAADHTNNPLDTTEPREAEGAAAAEVNESPTDAPAETIKEHTDKATDPSDAANDSTEKPPTDSSSKKADESAEPEQTLIVVEAESSVEARRLYSISIALYNASHPDEGRGRLWFEKLSSSGWVGSMAWLAAITEFVGGVLLLLGLMTRFWALGLATTMVVAMTLTTIGPTVQSGQTFLGFLPPLRLDEPGGAWVGAWMPWLFQLSMLTSALALVCLGSGAISLDRRVFGGKHPAHPAGSSSARSRTTNQGPPPRPPAPGTSSSRPL